MSSSVTPMFDLVVVADVRLTGAEARSFLVLLRTLAQTGRRVGVLHVMGPLAPPQTRIPTPLRSLYDPPSVCFIDPTDAVSTSLVLGWHVAPFLNPLDRIPRLEAAVRILRIDQPLRTAAGQRLAALGDLISNAAELMGAEPQLAPNDSTVRDELSVAAAIASVSRDDWPPPVSLPTAIRMRPGARTLVIGRHDADRPAAWPVCADLLRAVFDAPDSVAFRLMNCGARPASCAMTMTHLDVVTPKEHSERFLAGLDAYVTTGREEAKPFLDAALAEALAAGLPVIAPSGFAPLLGGAGILVDDWRWRNTYNGLDDSTLARASAAARQRRRVLGPVALRTRLARVLPQLSAERRSLVLRRDLRTRRRILMIAPNGVGIGHLVRLLAVARHLDVCLDPVFFTMSRAADLVRRLGYVVEYMGNHQSYVGHESEWHETLAERLEQVLTFYDPRVIVFDGNVPYAALVRILERHPQRLGVWLRRGMWRPDTGTEALKRARSFHLVIEPADYAEDYDRGPTRFGSIATMRVPPVVYLERSEIIPRNQARARLGIAAGAIAAIVMLGAGNNFEMTPARALVGEVLGDRRDVDVRLVRWPISRIDAAERGATVDEFPLARILPAFDIAISAAGYNSFHELLTSAVPSVFVPNQHPSMDEQEMRALWADRRGVGFCAPAADPDRLRWALHRLCDSETRAAMRQRMAVLPSCDGAITVARQINDLAHARLALAAGNDRSLRLGRG